MLIWLGKQMLGQADAPTVAIQNNIETRNLIEQQTKESDEEFIKMCDGSLPPRSERDAAFIKMYNEVRSEMPAPSGDMLGVDLNDD